MKIKKGDNVIVIAGKDRGRKGKVIRALPREARVVVEGINMHKKHVRPRRAGQKGQVVEMPSSMSVSNVKIVCAKCARGVRVGYAAEGARKARVCKVCGTEL